MAAIRVGGEGRLDAKIVIVGEAPGAEESRAGKPFVGSSGKLLTDCMHEAGISRSDCYITNVIKEQPPRNDISKFFSSKGVPTERAERYIEELKEELQATTANVIVPCGVTALRVLTGQSKISTYRGRLITSVGDRKTIPIYHPAAALRQWIYRHIIVFDLKVIDRESSTPSLNLPKRNLIVDPPASQAVAYIESAIGKTMAFDFETLRDQPIPTRISIATSPDFSFSVPLVDGSYSESQLLLILDALYELFKSDGKKIAQNSMFDLYVLGKTLKMRANNLWFDTMIAQNVLYPGFPKGLEFLASIYTREPPWKGGIDSPGLMNAKDSAVTFEVALAQDKLLNLDGNINTFRFDMSIVEPLLCMSLIGVKADTKEQKCLRNEIVKELEEAKRKFKLIAGDVNPNSPAQLAKLFYDELGAPVQYHRTTRKRTVDEVALVRLGKKGYGEIVKHILDIRSLGRTLSTNVDMAWDEQGRYRTLYNVAGTTTGRISSAACFNVGGNLQNIIRDDNMPVEGSVRKLFIADEGKTLVSADLIQAELVVVAYLANEHNMIKAFESREDMHNMVTCMIFSLDHVEKDSKERYIGKRSFHASDYGLGAIRLVNELAKEGIFITVSQAKAILEAIDKKFPNIRHWREGIRNELRYSRVLVSPLGRRGLFTDRWGDDLFRKGYAFKPQSTVGQLLNMGLVALYEKYGDRVELLLQVHDSVVVQVEHNLVEEAKLWLKECLEIPILINGKQVTIPVEVKSGKSWAEV